MRQAKLKPALLACLVMLAAAGCGSVNLGDIDETEDARDDMPGPGIFADENGESTLKWTVDTRGSDKESAQTVTVTGTGEAAAGIETESASMTAGQAAAEPTMDEKAEFEAFKKWNRLRTEGADSAEYQEFLLWLEYQKFKN